MSCTTRSPKQTDRAVVSLLNDQETKDSPVVRAIGGVLAAVDAEELDYGGQVRALTKALAIINERHRQRFAV